MALQSSRGFAATESTDGFVATLAGVPLQSSRGFAATETEQERHEVTPVAILQSSRGFAVTEAMLTARIPEPRSTFNLAVALRPRKPRRRLTHDLPIRPSI